VNDILAREFIYLAVHAVSPALSWVSTRIELTNITLVRHSLDKAVCELNKMTPQTTSQRNNNHSTQSPLSSTTTWDPLSALTSLSSNPPT